MTTTTKLDELIDFIIDNGEGRYSNFEREEMARHLAIHRLYGTLMTINDPKGLLAIARWNWVNPKKAHILDVVIRKDSRCLHALKGLLLMGIQHNPQCEEITFQREIKTGKTDFSTYKVKDILRRR
jgi:hypothetical protein